MLSLEEFIRPLSVDDLIRDFWPGELYVSETGPPRTALLEEVPELVAAEQVLAGYQRPVRLSRKGGPYASAPTGADAIPAYRTGFTCVMLGVEESFPGFKGLITDAARTFGLPVSSFTCEAFCSTGTSGLSMHSDFDLNFALLLHGQKRWRLARNRSIENQTSTCFSRGAAQADPRQERYAHSPFPDEMPEDSTEFEMGPGGILFVPRGWWHETYSLGDCLQVNLTIKGPHWAGVFTRAMETLLLEDPRWRNFAFGVTHPDGRRDAAVAELTALLDRLTRTGELLDTHELALRLLDRLDLENLSTGSQRKASKSTQGDR
ncbi:cupin domain-containing protein [Kitasatospora sp. NPDC096128]|uniref:JmjC domain-containing protein n=1 Tax=Kitasatospora sp. NPDC096128 TaxID=3155547 RepID=UPI003326F389